MDTSKEGNAFATPALLAVAVKASALAPGSASGINASVMKLQALHTLGSFASFPDVRAKETVTRMAFVT